MGLAGVCLKRDEVEKAHRSASRALEDVDDILFVVEEPADSIVVRNPSGTSEIVHADALRRDHGAAASAAFDRALAALEAAFPGGRVRARSSPDGERMTTASSTTSPREMAKLREAGTYKEELVLQSPQGAARQGRRPRGRDADLEQLPGLRQPPAHPRGAEEGRRPLGSGAGVGALHLRHAGAAQGARGRDRVLLRHRRHDPLHDLLERQRGPLRRGPRRAGRALLRRAQPRLDHRRRAPLQGEALPRAARRHRRPSRRCSRRTGPRASAL